MQTHEKQYPGTWSVPQMLQPCNGVLRVDEENYSIVLTLTAQHKEGDWGYRGVIHEDAPPVIYGRLFTGVSVALLGCTCFYRELSYGNQIEESFYADFACWDVDPVGGEVPVFRCGIFNLGEWVQWAGLSYVEWAQSEHANKTLVALHEADSIERPIGPDATITVYAETRTPFLRRYETQVMIGQWAMIAFSYSRSRSWHEIYSDALWFCRFVELGRGFATSIVGARCMRTGSALDAGLEEAPFHYGSLVSIGVGVKPCTSRLTPSHMCPFKLSDALECGTLESWFEKRELLEPIVGLLSVAYSSVVSTPSALFLNLMQALETLHSRFYAARLREYLSRVELLCESCSDSSLRNYLCDSGQLRARKVYLRSRMNDLFWADGVRPVEPDFCRFSECGDKLTKTRNYYIHYDQRLLSQCLPEDVLPAANVDLMALLTYHLMVILGFEKQFSREAVHRRFGV